MAAFCEKFHVSPEYYQHSMTIPQIALMSMDCPKIVYPKDKNGRGSGSNNTTGSIKRKVTKPEDIMDLINQKR